jgi:hypothetical protein
MGVLELFLSLGLILPASSASLGILAPIAAACIVAEMLLFSGLHVSSGSSKRGQIIYWLVVAVICAFVAYGRFVVEPL